MLTTISLDVNKAKSVDAPRTISKSGQYIGTIAQAEMHETASGANMLGLVFVGDNGSTTFLNLCLTTGDGKETFNMGVVHAMMHLLEVAEIQAIPAKVKNRKGETEMGHRVPALEKKKIGLLLQRVDDVYNDKQTYNLNVVSVFDPVTGKTSHETQTGKEAKQIAQRLEKLEDRKTQRLIDWLASGGNANGFESANRELQTKNTVDNLGEDIPW